ncbi:hypothetical protein CYMTET_5187 [Cymbomonas tetramitiformis]|uniref:Uncharacterized protein n=1 Tax=Cymbomonas tetramitiformis TaxID=36881 RepID=A0AAE0GZY0_9CHLO|nr:hypothetical protein CYMTET_5187 [Cymbomonas tetramitiformis]
MAKGKLQKLLKLATVSAKMRSTSWENQRAGLADLRLVLEVARSHTDALLVSELFAVDSSGAIAVGPWPTGPGAWAERTEADFTKFREVIAWAKALLALMAPSPAGGVAGSVGGSTASPAAVAGVAAAGTVGATGTPGIGTAAAAAVSPDVIAAAIATAFGTKLGDFSARLTSLACADLVHEAAMLRPQLIFVAEADTRPFGKLPMETRVEANAFAPMVYVFPELTEEECELDELPTGMEATLEHWREVVHIFQARVADFQQFVKSKAPTFPLTDVLKSLFFKKQKCVRFEEDEEEARAAAGGGRAVAAQS